MRGHRRVVLVNAASGHDACLRRQRELLSAWSGGEERDVSFVEIIGNAVTGAADTAAALRLRYQLSSQTFAVLLIGKDGHVALRAGAPQGGTALADAIDAMPMRRAGQR